MSEPTELIIGYDAKRAFRNNTGLGNYSRLVIESVAKENPDSRLLLYTPAVTDNPRMSGIRQLDNVEIRQPAPQGFKGALWRTFGITNHLRADKVNLFHGLSNELPLNIRDAGVPSIVTIHDVIYRRLPYCYKLIDRLTYDFKYGRSVRNADHVIAVSLSTKEDIVEFYGVDPDKVSVVYQGCDPGFKRMRSDKEKQQTRERYSLPERFILQVGTIEKRKNLRLTVSALPGIDKEVKLVVVGKDHYGYKKEVMKMAESLGVSDRIMFLEGLPFTDLPTLNQLADAVCYPSRYEGFGIPVLEGITSGSPVVAATGSCLEEAGGEGAIYVNPDSTEEMTEALRMVLNNEDERKRLIEAGRVHSDKFHIEKIASDTMDVYKKLL